ncbi:KpsF/GutQ family sugar-phosphate isomerase [Ichthyobacterium seriolicida]|uniref:D-arabinose 5-phosphate isomerase n=1 Tax=Ichthyobacterium seriolicida TaxID=242600 RepID=A0A1J1DZX0_9FLAO|nr:KpsF/GutQ family sugar-phosphate isomerase [Ichthyobacterium seriolicida]BAV95479.1 D-arabinose 5-phosphate isomerase [Ichthyobacterium seriolicida]
MKKKIDIIKIAREAILLQARSIEMLIPNLTDDLQGAVNLIHQSKGRVIITGIGKSANIALKIVATLNSTGTPSVFMHAADAIHGDLGIIQKRDVIICISKSGESPEMQVLAPLIRERGNKIISITGNPNSYLARKSKYVLNTSVEKEACINNLAPTCSTTAQLVMGDVLAVCLEELNGFSTEDFARYHPGGTLGKKLYLRAIDIIENNFKPSVNPDDPISKVILEVSSKRLGVTAVTINDQIIGIITDGDIRRMLENTDNFLNLRARDIMSHSPHCISPDLLAVNAIKIMKEKKITHILVAKDTHYLGVIHLHDIIKEGLS